MSSKNNFININTDNLNENESLYVTENISK